jgi:hypothetical protein
MAAAATPEKSGATFLPAMKTLHVCRKQATAADDLLLSAGRPLMKRR